MSLQNFGIIVFNQRALKCACVAEYVYPNPSPTANPSHPYQEPFSLGVRTPDSEVAFLHVTRRIAKHEYVNFLLPSLRARARALPTPLYCIKYGVDFTCVPPLGWLL